MDSEPMQQKPTHAPHARQCTGKSKRTGERCRAFAIQGRTTCRMHNGKAARGPAAPGYIDGRTLSKDGKYGAVLGDAFNKTYQRARTDENLTSLRDELALLDSELVAVVAQRDTAESGRTWRELQAAAKAFKEASAMRATTPEQEAEQEHRARLAMADVWRLIDHGAGEFAKREDTVKLVLAREKVARSERKRVHDERLMISIESAQLLMTLLVDAVTREVKDRDAVSRVINEFIRLTGRKELFTDKEEAETIDADYVAID